MQKNNSPTAYRKELRERILAASMEEFRKHGVRAVKMDDIANCLSISKRTLYEIYDNKEDLLFECVKTSFEHSEKELHESVENADNVMDILLRIYRLKMNLLRKTHPSFYCELEKYPKILEYFEKQDGKRRAQQMDFIKRGIREGYFRNDVNYDLILDLFDVSNRYIISNYNSLNYSMEQLSYNLVFVFLRGFCTLRGVEILDKFLDEDIYKPGFSPKEEK